MGKKRHTAEEIVAKLRQVDVLTAQGRTVAEAIRQIGVTEVTYYRWRSEYGGLKSDDGFYAPDCDAGLAWDDPDLAIAWPISRDEAILSDKDRMLPAFADFVSPFSYGPAKSPA